MIVVVADTSPLNYLIQIHSDHVLPALYERVFVPSAVIEELRHPRALAAVRTWLTRVPSRLVGHFGMRVLSVASRRSAAAFALIDLGRGAVRTIGLGAGRHASPAARRATTTSITAFNATVPHTPPLNAPARAAATIVYAQLFAATTPAIKTIGNIRAVSGLA